MRNYAGLFVVALATLMYETLLTRIFSITLLYHFAFMAISVGMFGMTVGAVIVYLAPRLFTPENTNKYLTWTSLLFGLFIMVNFLIYLQLPTAMNIYDPTNSSNKLLFLLFTYLLTGIPFLFSGIAICLALTKLSQPINKLYAADLAGAALGCLLLIPVLNTFDGPSAVFLVAAIACVSAALFASEKRLNQLKFMAIATALIFSTIAITNSILTYNNKSPIRLNNIYWFIPDKERLYERWNSFSRVLVRGDESVLHRPAAWGLSSTWPENQNISELMLAIDTSADTPLTQFNGDWGKINHLAYDVTNTVHFVRPHSNMLVVGVGGGRDILSALYFHQKHVTGIEINDRILQAITHDFANYIGNLHHYPEVTLVNDEARSYIARSKDKFDIIQLSLIDTYAATASGAFVFTENSLYTKEAWKEFLKHLTPTGVLSVSRWYSKVNPIETYRLLTLAKGTLNDLGIKNTQKNIVIVAATEGAFGGRKTYGVGTLLVSKEPFTDKDLDNIETFAKEKHFDIVLSPRTVLTKSSNPIFSIFSEIALCDELALEKYMEDFAVNITPPTDDIPFFFHMLKTKDIFNTAMNDLEGQKELIAVKLLWFLLYVVLALTFICIFLPLLLTTDRHRLLSVSPLLVYFASIGTGFMFIEISQMQRLIVFLGHPIYGLSVVLFTLLVGSGAGSYSISMKSRLTWLNSPIVRLGLLLLVLLIFGIITPAMTSYFHQGSMLIRILLSAAMLFPLGFFLGMAFPIGMTLAKDSQASLTPWLWGVNGATSVCASVLALVVSLTCGLSATFWTGFACYLIAFVAYYLINIKLAKTS